MQIVPTRLELFGDVVAVGVQLWNAQKAVDRIGAGLLLGLARGDTVDYRVLATN